jgi:beta-glucosidase
MTKTKLWRGLTAVFAILLTVSIFLSALCFEWAGQINIFLKVETPTIVGTEETTYYKSEYGLSDAGLAAMLVASDKHDIQTVEEGAVLLKNENAALPLRSTERSVTLFGRAVADPVYKGNSGGPGVDAARQVSLHTALKDAGFSINEALYNAYASSNTIRIKTNGTDADIGEEEPSFYTPVLQGSYASQYNDVAIVMLARDGGEGKDLSRSDKDGVSALALHETEKNLLTMVRDSGKFGKTIVLINSAYAMELGWLETDTYGVDAALWIGGTGLIGFRGVAGLLTGSAGPSGHFVDTYAADSLSSAAVQNAFSFKFANTNDNYVVELEGVYGGYKYYETRYQDSVLNVNNANGTKGAFASTGAWNYAAEMVYPFGYGGSYADFTQELVSLDWNRTTHKVTATVKVTNNGYPVGSAYTGKSKSVAQLYVQLPYATGMSQKSAVQLVDFVKTGLLGTGETETVTIETSDYIFATYDNKAVNGADTSKKGCYVFDPGKYYFAIGADSHDALNNILAARAAGESLAIGTLTAPNGLTVTGNADKTAVVSLAALDNASHARSPYTGDIVSNQFDDIDINHFFQTDVVTYLTREDWNTFPNPANGLSMTDEMKTIRNRTTFETPAGTPSYASFTQGADVTIKLIEMKDVPFDDLETWNKFLDQLTIGEMAQIVGENFGQSAIARIGKPYNKNTDGPSGSQSSYVYGAKRPATIHVNEVVATSTWNKQILADRGSFIAEDCLFSGTSQLWSPGGNLHRTPFSGRNFEYYSEDGVMSYIMGAVQTEAMQAKGLCAAIKHFAGNDQETNRTRLCTFRTEQAWRQGSLRGFEGAFAVGGSLGTMLSTSSIGCAYDLYMSAATLTQVLRNEWGFKGVTITDSVAGIDTESAVPGLVAGTDTFNANPKFGSAVQKYLATNKDGYVLQCMREANKRFYYAMVHSSMINGLTVDTVIEDFVPWWQPTLKAVVAVIGVCTLAAAGLFVYGTYFSKKRKPASEAK